MQTKTYLLADDKIKFCLKKLKSFKTSRWLSPLMLLGINYFFIMVMFPTGNKVKFLLIYILFSTVTTIIIFYITTAAIKRYRNIITEVKLTDDGSVELDSLFGDTVLVKKQEFSVTNDVFSVNRNEKFKAYTIKFNDENLLLITEWFQEQSELEIFCNNNCKQF